MTLLTLGASSYAGTMGEESTHYPFYFGLNGGYGSTTWAGLVPDVDKQNIALSISTPSKVEEGGEVYGGVIGFEFTPQFALEANYLSYPAATIRYEKTSLFAFKHKGQTMLHTRTEAVSLMAKVLFNMPKSKVRPYSAVGIGNIHRKDGITNAWLITPSFAAGLNIPLFEHLMCELVGNYMAGYGKSEIDPVESFVPFLYAGFVRLAYRL